MRRWCLALVAGLALAMPLMAQPLEEPLSASGPDGREVEGRIDWTDRTLVVYGEGVAPAGIENPGMRRLLGERAAKTVAYRNLLELVGQVRVDGETMVSMAMVSSDSIRTQVSGLVRGATMVPGSRQEKDGVYRVALRLSLTDEFARALLPAGASLPSGSTSTPAAAAAPPEPASPPSRFAPQPAFTGLVVDARGLDVRPGLSPRVMGPAGQVIYSGASAEASYAASMGVVGYQRDWDDALVSDRLGRAERRPLTVKATGVSGQYRADVVVSEDDRVRIAMADAVGGFLRQCRVIFVVGPQATSAAPTAGSH